MEYTYNKAFVFKSLGDDTRLEIVRKLASDGGEVNSKQIVSGCAVALNLSQPTMSHHFHTLVAAGVIIERKVGVEKYYKLNKPLLKYIGLKADKL